MPPFSSRTSSRRIGAKPETRCFPSPMEAIDSVVRNVLPVDYTTIKYFIFRPTGVSESHKAAFIKYVLSVHEKGYLSMTIILRTCAYIKAGAGLKEFQSPIELFIGALLYAVHRGEEPSSNDQVYWDSVLRYSEADIEAIRKKFAKAIQRSNARVDPIDAYNEVVNDVYEGPEKPKERELRQRLFLVCPGSRSGICRNMVDKPNPQYFQRVHHALDSIWDNSLQMDYTTIKYFFFRPMGANAMVGGQQEKDFIEYALSVHKKYRLYTATITRICAYIKVGAKLKFPSKAMLNPRDLLRELFIGALLHVEYIKWQPPHGKDYRFWSEVLGYSTETLKTIQKEFASLIHDFKAQVDDVQLINAYNDVVKDVYRERKWPCRDNPKCKREPLFPVHIDQKPQ